MASVIEISFDGGLLVVNSTDSVTGQKTNLLSTPDFSIASQIYSLFKLNSGSAFILQPGAVSNIPTALPNAIIDQTGKVLSIVADPNETGHYLALLTQSGTDAPVVTVVSNTLGDIVWTYSSEGTYLGTLTGAFLLGKCGYFVQFANPDIGHWAQIQRANNNACSVATFNAEGDNTAYANGILSNTPVFIWKVA